MNLDLLNNPIWHALNSHHRHLAVRSKMAIRYQHDTFAVAAMRQSNAPGLEDLTGLVDVGETISLFGGSLPENLTGWKVLRNIHLPQMVCEDPGPSPHVDAIELAADDVPEMRALVALARPGPFLRRTIEMGQYLGLREEGQLVAIAGQRLHLTGFCEISAVCTHPDYRGRGYGGALTTLQAELILARQETPFLHLAPTNDGAMRLYKKLGFRLNQKIRLSVLRKLA